MVRDHVIHLRRLGLHHIPAPRPEAPARIHRPHPGIELLRAGEAERKRREDEVWRQANFDGLTGLPNRQLLEDRLGRVLRQPALELDVAQQEFFQVLLEQRHEFIDRFVRRERAADRLVLVEEEARVQVAEI